MLSRKQKAESLKNKDNLQNYETPPEIKEKNEYIECASAAIKIEQNQEMGRHIIAKRDIKPGEVLAVEEPYAKILLKDRYLTHCYNCLKPSYNLMPCVKCPLVFFCNENCREIAWNYYHRYECPILATLLESQVTNLPLTALRVTICAKNEYRKLLEDNSKTGISSDVISKEKPSVEEIPPREFSKISISKDHISNQTTLNPNKKYESSNYEQIHNLVGNENLRQVSDLFSRALHTAVFYKLVKKYSQFFESKNEEELFKELLLKHAMTASSNFHQITELAGKRGEVFEIVEIGGGAYSFLSLLNHSCCPNVIRHCHGSKIVLRALRPIAKEEQLFDNYGYVLNIL